MNRAPMTEIGVMECWSAGILNLPNTPTLHYSITPMTVYDVAIVGGGPAGSACATFCAAAGLETVLIEREKFPREKVCGDCINPACWEVLRRLEVADRIQQLA